VTNKQPLDYPGPIERWILPYIYGNVTLPLPKPLNSRFSLVACLTSWCTWVGALGPQPPLSPFIHVSMAVVFPSTVSMLCCWCLALSSSRWPTLWRTETLYFDLSFVPPRFKVVFITAAGPLSFSLPTPTISWPSCPTPTTGPDEQFFVEEGSRELDSAGRFDID
jgi:hypothetical protein